MNLIVKTLLHYRIKPIIVTCPEFGIKETIDNMNVLSKYRNVISAYFNNDGYEDIFLVDSGTDCCGSPGNQNTLLLGKSNGTLINASFTNLPNFSDANHALAVGDIDNDGDLDIISAQQGRPLYPSGSVENKPEIYINYGTGNFELDYSRWPESQDLESGTAVALIVFDRDGLRDVVFSGQYSPLGGSYPRQALVLMRNKGNGFFEFTDGTMRNSELAAVKTNNGYEEHVEMKVADVNADGWEDLLVCLNLGSYKGARIDLYLNDKQGNLVKKINGFQSDQFGEKSTNFWYIYLKPADFNSDG